MNEPRGRLLRPDELACELNISRREIYRLIASGAFEIVCIGRALRVTRASLEAWIKNKIALASYERGFSVPGATGDDPRICPIPPPGRE